MVAKCFWVKCQLFLLLFAMSAESMQLVLSWSCLTVCRWLNLHPGRRVLSWDTSQLNLCRNYHLRFIPNQVGPNPSSPDIPWMDWFEAFRTIFVFHCTLMKCDWNHSDQLINNTQLCVIGFSCVQSLQLPLPHGQYVFELLHFPVNL